jgi:predicted metal-binding membrane protein
MFPSVEQKLARTSIGAGAAIIVIAAAAWLVTARAPDTMGMGAWPFLGTWTAMMTAMMLPSAAPLLLLYRRGSRAVDTAALGLGYLLVWGALGYAAYAYVMWGPMLPIWSVLAVAGIYQLTPLKGSCLTRCRTPADFLVRRYGRAPLLLGIEHGLWCAGCCWGLMFILVAVGSMSLAWAAGIAAVVLVEKVAPSGDRLARIGGIVLVVLALMEGVF